MKFFASLFLATSLLTGFIGCQSAPETTATKVAAVQITTVDAAMQAWADWVRAGNATQTQIVAVHNAYDKYYALALAEKKALSTYVAGVNARTNGPAGPVNPDYQQFDYHVALDAVIASQAELLSMINTFQGKPNI